MKFPVLSLAVLTAFLFGCTKSNQDVIVQFHDDGRAKPTVALVPLIDQTQEDSISAELTSFLTKRLNQGNLLFISLSQTDVNTAHSPFGKDISWMKTQFPTQEFVIFTQLIEHNLVKRPLTDSFFDKLKPSYELVMTMRVRVIDLRGEPKVILQELVDQTRLIPKSFSKVTHEEDYWKKTSYLISPIGYAHRQLTKEVASRVETYIMLAKTQ